MVNSKLPSGKDQAESGCLELCRWSPSVCLRSEGGSELSKVISLVCLVTPQKKRMSPSPGEHAGQRLSGREGIRRLLGSAIQRTGQLSGVYCAKHPGWQLLSSYSIDSPGLSKYRLIGVQPKNPIALPGMASCSLIPFRETAIRPYSFGLAVSTARWDQTRKCLLPATLSVSGGPEFRRASRSCWPVVGARLAMPRYGTIPPLRISRAAL